MNPTLLASAVVVSAAILLANIGKLSLMLPLTVVHSAINKLAYTPAPVNTWMGCR